MKLNFNLEDIECLKLDFDNEEYHSSIKLALKEKRENDFLAIAPTHQKVAFDTPQKITLTFICHDGLYKTTTIVNDIYEEDGYKYFVINNPESLDYQQNREYYRILSKYDCIYTIDTGSGIESFNAVTYDISAGGVSIISSENIVPTRETSIVICMPERNLKAHIQFVRCEAYGEDEYKLSFFFVDLSDKDYKFLSDLCVQKQLHSF